MAQQDTNLPDLKISPLLGLNERAALNAIPDGEWSILQGLYPSQFGQLSRIPGKRLLSRLSSPIFNLHQTNDGSGNIIVQTATDLQVFTLDDLLGRAIMPSLVYTPLIDDESMPQAILVHREPNNKHGGSLDGFVTAASTRGNSRGGDLLPSPPHRLAHQREHHRCFEFSRHDGFKRSNRKLHGRTRHVSHPGRPRFQRR